MDLLDIELMLHSPKYDFLRADEHLGKNIMLLTLGGSYAYGTQSLTSDVDIRGVTLERPHEWIGLSNFEQFECKATDTVIYGFKKIIKLLINCNPNVIELLATDENMIFHISPEGRLLRDNIYLFLSQKAAYSFGGYATSQLRRIQNALARDEYPQAKKEEHMSKSIQHALESMKEAYAPFTDKNINIYIDESSKKDYETEIFLDVNLRHYPLRDFKNIQTGMINIIKDYSKLTGRNKKTNAKLEKHAMHLVRLLLMGKEILEGKPVRTNRTNTPEYKTLLDIRNGVIPLVDVFSIVDELEKEFEYAKKHSPLPKKPDFKKIEEFVMLVGKRAISESGGVRAALGKGIIGGDDDN